MHTSVVVVCVLMWLFALIVVGCVSVWLGLVISLFLLISVLVLYFILKFKYR